MTQLRPARPDDLDGVMAIETASFPTDAWSRSSMAATLADRDAAALVATEADTIIGYAAVLAPRGASDADILTLAVAQAARGRGTGRELLQGLLTVAAGRGASRVFLEVRADNPVAAALYASTGFQVVGRRPRYYQPDDVDAVVMRLELPVGVR